MLGKYEELQGQLAVLYARKSQEDDEKQVLSFGKQGDINQDIVHAYKLRTTSKHQFEEAKSAKVSGQRPLFDRMVKLIKSGSIDVVVTWQLSRLARNMQEGGLLIDLLHMGYLKAILTKDKAYFPNDNTIIIAIEAAMATEYSRNLSRNVIEANERKERLHLPNAAAPIGYINNKHKEQGERDWSDDPERLDSMRLIMRRLLSGNHSAYSVWKWAREELKLTTPVRKGRGGHLISCSYFYTLLRKPEYAGFKFNKDGEKILLKGYTPILTEDEFWNIQDHLGQEGRTRPKNEVSTYSEYLVSPSGEYCGADRTFRARCTCGHKYSASRKKACPTCGIPIEQLEPSRLYVAKHYYNVPRRKRKEACRYVNEKNIDTVVLEMAENELLMEPELQEWSRTYLHELKDEHYNEEVRKAEGRRAHAQQIDTKLQNAKNALVDGALNSEEYRDVVRDLKRQKSDALDISSTPDWFEKCIRLTSIGEDIVSLWSTATVDKKREVLAELGSNFIWDEEKVSISNPKWLDQYISGYNALKAKSDWLGLVDKVKKASVSNAKLLLPAQSWSQFPEMCTFWENVRTEIISDGELNCD